MLSEGENLLCRLAAADRVYQKEHATALLLRGTRYACGFVLAAFCLDVVFHLSAPWRLGILLTGLAGVAGLLAVAWYFAFVRRNRPERIARFLESHHPTLGSRLINLLQLSQQTSDPNLAPLTRELARQAVRDYAAEMSGLPVEKLARTGSWRVPLRRAGWVWAGFAAILLLGLRISGTEFARFIDPFGDHPPYSFTRLDIVDPGPTGTNVLYGKGLVVSVRVSGHQPREVFLTAFPPGHPEQAVTTPMFDKNHSRFDQLLEPVRSDLLVYAHTRDASSVSKQVRIRVELTPQLERAFVQVSPPSYTGLAAQEKPYSFKGVQALEGSQVRFRLQSNRPLREGRLEISGGDHPPQVLRMEPDSENEVAASFTATESGRLKFTLLDTAGRPSPADCEGALTVTYDLPPEVRIVEPEHDAFVSQDLKLLARIEASDDYGLRTLRLHRGLNGVYSAPRVVSYNTVVRDSRETLEFPIGELGVQSGDVLSFFAEVTDTAPQPHFARSQTVRLQVITVEQYNDFLRQRTDLSDAAAKYEELGDELQALIEEQKQLGAAAQKLGEQIKGAAARTSSEAAQQLDALLARQNELNQKLNEQASRMENFVRSNPLYDVEKEAQQALRLEADKIRKSTQSNTGSAKEISRRSMPASGGRSVSREMLSDFRRASDDQVERLGGARDSAEQETAGVMEDMSRLQELIKDFNQFQALHQAQTALTEQAQAYNRPGQLNREDQLAMKDMAGTEKQVAVLLDKLQGKLRSDADAAEKLFPKAAASARKLAARVEEARIQPLAEQATDQMLAGRGEPSYQLAERVRQEMDKLFQQCQGGNCPSSHELDQYLTLQRMSPGNNFAQMSRSRKFGVPGNRGMANGPGDEESASSGYAVMDGSTLSVLGNEMAPRRQGATSRQSSRFGHGAGATDKPATGIANSDVVKGLNPVNRLSGAVSSETVIEEYNDVVEHYFKTITTQPREQSHER